MSNNHAKIPYKYKLEGFQSKITGKREQMTKLSKCTAGVVLESYCRVKENYQIVQSCIYISPYLVAKWRMSADNK